MYNKESQRPLLVEFFSHKSGFSKRIDPNSNSPLDPHMCALYKIFIVHILNYFHIKENRFIYLFILLAIDHHVCTSLIRDIMGRTGFANVNYNWVLTCIYVKLYHMHLT